MRWIDGSEIDVHPYTGEALCEKLSLEMWGSCKMEHWPRWPDVIQVAYFIIAFDTELAMEGIFTFLENSIGHYAPQIIRAFRAIGDDHDADILEEICALCPPDVMRGELLEHCHQEYEISCFDEDHERKEEVAEKITRLAKGLYLSTGADIWAPLFDYVDKKIAAL